MSVKSKGLDIRMVLQIPEEAGLIIKALEKGGHEAYVVGGCVRDSILGQEPKDWDICTSALPEETMECLKADQIIETGLKHGTVTVVKNKKPYEVTTFRVDGEYADNRRPDSVEFITSVEEDLARRDFTINAIAYNGSRGIVDPFHGRVDIEEKKIRCVGDADKRFQEDALRIMRALRFSAVLGFEIEAGTSEAIIKNKSLLDNIAVERIAAELNKLLLGETAAQVMKDYTDIMVQIIPEIKACVGFSQNNFHHYLDVWGHILKSVEEVENELVLKLTVLLHDIAKPICYTEKDGVGHFYGHQQEGAKIASEILTRLKYDNATISEVVELILYHDANILPESKYVKRWLNKIGESTFRKLLKVKRADDKAKAEEFRQARFDQLDKLEELIDKIIEEKQCFSIKDLAIDGDDLIELGIVEGVKIGEILNSLVSMVIDEEIENDKEKLLNLAQSMIKGE